MVAIEVVPVVASQAVRAAVEEAAIVVRVLVKGIVSLHVMGAAMAQVANLN